MRLQGMTSRRRPGPAPALSSLLLAVALVLAGCGSSGTAGPRDQTRPPAPAHRIATVPTSTVVHTYTGYGTDGRPAAVSTSTENGYCWNSSLAAVGPTAFRCFSDASSGGRIYDPCFAPATPSPTTVSCVNDPWSTATTLRLTRPLPEPVADGAARPWALQLATGARCVASTGTVPSVGGVNLSYHCSDRTAAALEPATSALLHAVYADPDATVLSSTTVVGVWRTS